MARKNGKTEKEGKSNKRRLIKNKTRNPVDHKNEINDPGNLQSGKRQRTLFYFLSVFINETKKDGAVEDNDQKIFYLNQ